MKLLNKLRPPTPDVHVPGANTTGRRGTGGPALLQEAVAETSSAELAGLVRLAVLRLNRALRANPADSVVTPAARAALGTLAAHGAMSPGELARRESVRPPAVTPVLATLERQDLVVRRPHPTDGRQSIIELTPAGSALVEEIRAREAWLASRIRDLPERDRRTLLRALSIVETLARP